jgi:hypothetical protein
MKTTANAGIGLDQNGINTHATAQIGDLSFNHQESQGIFHNASQTSWNCFGFGDSKETHSSISRHGYDSSQSKTTHFGEHKLGSSESTHIGKDGVNYQVNYNFFGKKLNWGFHIPAMPELGILNKIHAFWHNFCQILGKHNFSGGLKEAGHFFQKGFELLMKIFSCLGHVFKFIGAIVKAL